MAERKPPRLSAQLRNELRKDPMALQRKHDEEVSAFRLATGADVWNATPTTPSDGGHPMTRRAILNEPEKWAVVPVEPTAWVPSYALSILHQEGHHVAVPTALHKKQLKSGNGTALYARPDPDALADLVAYVAGLEARLAEAEKVIDQVTDIYGNMEDGDGNPCDVIRAARAWQEGK